MNNELILNNKAALAMPGLFVDFNFSDLNKSIETLASSGKDLTPEEKGSAVKIVEEWEGRVIERLRVHARDLEAFIEYLDPSTLRHGYWHRDFDLDKDQMLALAGQTGTIDSLQMYLDSRDRLEQHELAKPMDSSLTDDDTMSYEERITIRKDQEKEWALWELQKKRMERSSDLALYDWKKSMQENDDIKKLIAYARQYKRNLGKFTRECQDKSQLARLNISISSVDTREALKELLKFVTAI